MPFPPLGECEVEELRACSLGPAIHGRLPSPGHFPSLTRHETSAQVPGPGTDLATGMWERPQGLRHWDLRMVFAPNIACSQFLSSLSLIFLAQF